MTAAICSAETEYSSGPPLSTLIFTRDSYCSFFSFLFNILCIIVCLFVLFPLAIALPVVIRFTASHYPFGIFKLFFHNVIQMVQGKAGTFYICIWDNSHQNNMRKSSQKRYITGYKDKFVVCKWVNFHIYHSERLTFREMIARLVLGLQTELEF